MYLWRYLFFLLRCIIVVLKVTMESNIIYCGFAIMYSTMRSPNVLLHSWLDASTMSFPPAVESMDLHAFSLFFVLHSLWTWLPPLDLAPETINHSLLPFVLLVSCLDTQLWEAGNIPSWFVNNRQNQDLFRTKRYSCCSCISRGCINANSCMC